MSKFGVPYMGSKSSIVKDILELMPSAENFYDLFGGGGCVSHCAIEKFSHKWKSVHYNELKSDVAQLVRDGIAGKYNYNVFKPEWISRERFKDEKESNAYIRLIWSFGNNQKDYLFGKNIETKKKSLHQAVVFGEFDDFAKSVIGDDEWPDEWSIKERRLFCRRAVVEKIGERGDLQRLEQLQQLERLSISSSDYADVIIKPNSIIYCDIPYKGTTTYLQTFDYERFFDWAANNKTPVFISEFNINDPRFVCIFEKSKIQKLAAHAKNGKRKAFIEKVYVNRAALDLMSEKQREAIA